LVIHYRCGRIREKEKINNNLPDLLRVKLWMVKGGIRMKQNFTQYIMVALLVVGAYMVGVYKTKVEYLEGEHLRKLQK